MENWSREWKIHLLLNGFSKQLAKIRISQNDVSWQRSRTTALVDEVSGYNYNHTSLQKLQKQLQNMSFISTQASHVLWLYHYILVPLCTGVTKESLSWMTCCYILVLNEAEQPSLHSIKSCCPSSYATLPYSSLYEQVHGLIKCMEVMSHIGMQYNSN